MLRYLVGHLILTSIYLAYFGTLLFNYKISLEEAKEQQKEILGIINELKKRTDSNKQGHPLSKKNEDDAKNLIKNAEDILDTRENIINVFKKLKNEKGEQFEESEKSEESEDEINQKIPPWMQVLKERFNETKNIVNKAVKEKLQPKLTNFNDKNRKFNKLYR